MLILSRKIGETLVIGEGVFFTVLGVKGNQVRLGIDAPVEVPVHRMEIHLKNKAQQEVQKVSEKKKLTLVDIFRARQKTTVVSGMAI